MRRRKRQSVESTDFRKVSELVHERRAERARNSETLRENPEAAEAAVRTYRPEQRLRSVDRETQQLVRDSRDIPRMWDLESFSPTPRTPWPIRTNYLLLLVPNILLAPWILIELSATGRDFHIGASVAIMLVAILATGSIAYFRELGAMAFLGLAICIAEIAFFLVIVSR